MSGARGGWTMRRFGGRAVGILKSDEDDVVVVVVVVVVDVDANILFLKL